jgi:hypothetical protein
VRRTVHADQRTPALLSVEHHRQATARPPKPRECRLCGQLFFAAERCGQRYCTPEHRREHARRQRAVVIADGSGSSAPGAPLGSVTAWRERVRRLEVQVAQARAELAGREAA